MSSSCLTPEVKPLVLPGLQGHYHLRQGPALEVFAPRVSEDETRISFTRPTMEGCSWLDFTVKEHQRPGFTSLYRQVAYLD
jgi:hypothetical protein